MVFGIVLVSLIVLMLAACAFAPFVLSGQITEQEERIEADDRAALEAEEAALLEEEMDDDRLAPVLPEAVKARQRAEWDAATIDMELVERAR